MIVRETTHHGDFYRTREVSLPNPPGRGHVAMMLASCVYPYTHVDEERLNKVLADLLAGQEASHGWTRWEAVDCAAQTYGYANGVQVGSFCDRKADKATEALDGSRNLLCEEHAARAIEAGAREGALR